MSLQKLLADLNHPNENPKSKRSLVKNIFSPSAPTPSKLKTTSEWYDLKSSKMSDELQRDIQLLNMRNSIDPSHRYKSTVVGKKKFVQYGNVIESPYDWYSSGLASTKKKPKSILDSLLQDDEFKRRTEEKYMEITRNKSRISKRR